MRTRASRWLLLFVSALLPGLMFPVTTSAQPPCAFVDVNDNGTFDPGTDIAVPDAQWLGGTRFQTDDPFVVAAGCVFGPFGGTDPAVTGGIRVIATKITFLGSLRYKAGVTGGKGVLLKTVVPPSPCPPGNGCLGDGSINIGNGSATGVLIFAGGDVPPSTDAPATTLAISYYKSIAIWSTFGTCNVNFATLQGTNNKANTGIGMLCNKDIVLRNTTIAGAEVMLESETGRIDAQSFAASGGPTLADLCDSSSLNVVNGAAAPGDDDVLVDADDFPCQLNLAGLGGIQFDPTQPAGYTPIFATADALVEFCKPSNLEGKNQVTAVNGMLMLKTGAGNLDLRGVAPSGQTTLSGGYGVLLVSRGGDVLAQDAVVNNGPDHHGGAQNYVFANPTKVVEYAAYDKQIITSPSTGTTNVDGACFTSNTGINWIGKNPVGGMNLVGTPAPCSAFQPTEQLTDTFSAQGGPAHP